MLKDINNSSGITRHLGKTHENLSEDALDALTPTPNSKFIECDDKEKISWHKGSIMHAFQMLL